MWAIIANILKAVGKQALKAAAANALGHMGGMGVALGNLAGSGSQSLAKDNEAPKDVESVKPAETKSQTLGKIDWDKVGNFMTDLAANNPQQPMPSSMPLEDDYRPLKLDEAGKKVLLSRMDEYGKKLTPKETLEAYKRTHKSLGEFASDYDADEYARKLKRERNYYGF